MLDRDGGAPLDYAALPGATNRSWRVGGSNDLTVPDHAAHRPAELTLEAWVLADQDQHYEGLVTKISNNGWGDGYGIVRVGGAIRFWVNYWAGEFVEAALPEDTWTHVAGTYDGEKLRLYIDGELAAEKAFTGTINHSTAPISIGSAPGGSYLWGGSVDEVRLWNVARTGEEIAAAMAAPITGAPGSLVGYWRFDEADGATVADASATAATATRRVARASETQTFRFAAQEGDHFFVDRLSSSGSLTARVLRPDGKVLAGPTGLTDLDLVDLPMDGIYTIVVEGQPGAIDPAAFSLKLLQVADDQAALTIGATTTGHISPGQQDLYSFTLASDRTLVFDGLVNPGSVNWTLTGPRGIEMSARSFTSSNSYDSYYESGLNLPAGDYQLRIDGAGDVDTDYAFRLVDIASGIAVTLDTEVTGSIDPAAESDVYRFSGAAGDQIAITKLVGNGGGDTYLRIIDPAGRPITNPAWFYNTINLTLPMAGTYTILLESRYYVGTAHPYSFTVSKTGNVPPADLSQGVALTLGASVTGTLDGSTPDLHTFTTTGPKRVYLDSQTWDGGKNWTLIGPRGVEVGPLAFSNTDSWDRSGNLVIDLPEAGTYQLRVAGSAGNYAFRLLDLSSATPVALDNTLVSGPLNPANVTHAFKFDGTAGETIFFDARDGIDGTIRVIDAFGRLVFGPDYFDDREILLPSTGTYTLLVEGPRLQLPQRAVRLHAKPAQRRGPVRADAGRPGRRHAGPSRQPATLHFHPRDAADDRVRFVHSRQQPQLDADRAGRHRFGQLLFERQLRAHVLPTTLLPAGDYELVIDGAGGTHGNYSFRLLDLAAAAIALAGDGTETVGSLTTAKETDVYSFTASAGERFAWDNTQTPHYPSFRLIDPFGRDATSAMGYDDKLSSPSSPGPITCSSKAGCGKPNRPAPTSSRSTARRSGAGGTGDRRHRERRHRQADQAGPLSGHADRADAALRRFEHARRQPQLEPDGACGAVASSTVLLHRLARERRRAGDQAARGHVHFHRLRQRIPHGHGVVPPARSRRLRPR